MVIFGARVTGFSLSGIPGSFSGIFSDLGRFLLLVLIWSVGMVCNFLRAVSLNETVLLGKIIVASLLLDGFIVISLVHSGGYHGC